MTAPLSLGFGHRQSPSRYFPDVTARIDNEYLIGHINLRQMHIIQHFLHAVSQNLVIATVPEKPDRNHYITFKGKFLLNSQNSSLNRVLPHRVMTLYFPCIEIVNIIFLYAEMYNYNRIITEL